MPVGDFVPSEFEFDYPRWTAPGIAYNGYVWAWNNTAGKYEPTALAFDPAGTGATEAAAAVAAHVALSNPHSQYYLASGVSAYGATLASAADATAARTALALGTMAVATETNYLLANGSRTGATSSRQTFTSGITTGSIRPPADGTAAFQVQTTAGTAIVTVDTTNARIGIGTVPLEKIHVFGGSSVAYAIFTNDATTNNANRGAFFGIDIGANSYNWNWENKTMFFGTSGATRMRVTGAGLIAAGSQLPTALLDIDSSTSSRASLRIRAGTAPSGTGGPNAGDIWYPTGGRLSLYRAATEIFATGVQATGGAATAGASYTSAEQSMLQKVYDACRAFGLLS